MDCNTRNRGITVGTVMVVSDFFVTEKKKSLFPDYSTKPGIIVLSKSARDSLLLSFTKLEITSDCWKSAPGRKKEDFTVNSVEQIRQKILVDRWMAPWWLVRGSKKCCSTETTSYLAMMDYGIIGFSFLHLIPPYYRRAPFDTSEGYLSLSAIYCV